MWSKEAKKFFYDPENVYVCLKWRQTDKDLFNDMVWQQFTGLVDKNGKEIYEGDLLEFAYTDNKKFVGKVEYEEKFACFVVATGNAFETFSDLADYTSSFKVVGNIFENATQSYE